MRILVCTAIMEIGGSQLNAIELAAQCRDMGHDVTVYAPPGELVGTVADLGLPYEEAPAEVRWPTWRNAQRMTEVSRRLGIDVLHGYEWRPTIDLTIGPHLRLGIPAVTTVLSMTVGEYIPTHLPMIVGTNELAELERARRPLVELMEPPIDTKRHRPRDGLLGERFGLSHEDFVVAVVCRMTDDLEKTAGVLQAIDAVAALPEGLGVRLLVVGGGVRLEDVRMASARANQAAGRDAVVVTGPLLDPSDAYACADVVVGMGSSALKGLAYGKPLIVQGTQGFWELLDESSLPQFLHQGWFGHHGGGAATLAGLLVELRTDPGRTRSLGSWGRRLVVERFSLEEAAKRLVLVYEEAMGRQPAPLTMWRSIALSGAHYAKLRASIVKERLTTDALKT